MRTDYEYIVLGLGGIGSGATYWLSRRAGADVLGIEQFELGHPNGGSQDHSRIIRLSYHAQQYVELAKAAYAAWDTLEADAGEDLIVKTGGLDFFPPGGPLPYDHYIEALIAAGVEFEQLDAEAVMRRWPVFKNIPAHVPGLFQPDGGIAPAAKCNAAHVRMAREHGATLLDKTPVTGLREVDGEIEVSVEGATYRARKLVIASGGWTNKLLAHLGMELPLRVSQEQVIYYNSPNLEPFMPERFPIWIWLGTPNYYGFPVYGEQSVKVAQDLGGETVTVDTRTFEPNPANQERVDGFVKKHLPDAFGPINYVKTCLYTLTPDREFLLDKLPGHPNIALAVGAGHGFKFASLIGKVLSELSIDDETGHDISLFKADRPIMKEGKEFHNFIVS